MTCPSIRIKNIDYVICPICNKEFKQITLKHIELHNLSIKQFKKMFPEQKLLCEKTFEKRSSIRKDKKHTKEAIEKNRIAHLGKKQSEESNRKRSEKLKGRVSPMKGKISHRKSKTNIEEYGEEKAQKIKNSISKTTKESMQNEQRRKKCINKISRKGIKLGSNIERFGEEKASRISKKQSNEKSGKKQLKKSNSKRSESVKKWWKENKNTKKVLERNKKISKCSRIQRLSEMKQNGGKFPSYNKNTIPIFQEFDRLNNTRGIYATNPYEFQCLGYSLDYINFDLKLIIEIDEPRHEKPIQKAKDLVREKEIQEFYPDFKFLRFKDTEMNKTLEIKL